MCSMCHSGPVSEPLLSVPLPAYLSLGFTSGAFLKARLKVPRSAQIIDHH
jgi:hypothetical protein